MDASHTTFATLADVLARLLPVFERLIHVQQQEREAIRTLADSQFAHINFTRQTLLDELAVLEEARHHAAAQIAAALGLTHQDVTLQDLIVHASPDLRPNLQHSYERLNQTIAEVRNGLGANRHVITRFLGVLQESLHVGAGVPASGASYSAAGIANAAQGEGRFVQEKG